tara:strand:- start:150 stop:299 length:150 start_codon:yes stop_codon:yes gene_type:complete
MEAILYYGILALAFVFLLMLTSLIFMELIATIMDKHYEWKHGKKPWKHS